MAALVVASAPSVRKALRAWRGQGAAWRAAAKRYPDSSPARAGDRGRAADVRFRDPIGLGADARGRVFVSDRGHAVWRIDLDGTATLVAGTGRLGRPRPGAPGRDSDLGTPEGLCVDAEGGVLFADSLNHMVLRVAPDGRLERIAGTGRAGFAGDGGPAADAQLSRPYDVRLDSRGNLFVADFGNHRIRRVSRDGSIASVAGTGKPGYSGDGGPATAARLNGPYAIWLDADDRLLIADSGNHVIRRVGRDGRIETIAGSGRRGFAGDGGPALAARFDSPQCLAEDAAGRLYVCDEHNRAIRRIGADGTVETVAGRLEDPEAVLPRPDGSLLICDGDAHLVRRVDAEGRLATFAGSGEAP